VKKKGAIMSRRALRIVAFLVAALIMLSIVYPIGAASRVDRGLSRAKAARDQLSAQFFAYMPIIRTPPPLPTKLISSADVDVIQGFPTDNYGADDAMWLGYHKADCTNSTASGRVSRDLIQFDLSAIPPATSITKATMNIRVVGECWNTRATAPVTAYRVTRSWLEAASTWNTQPTTAEAVGSVSIPFNFQAGAWYTIDVTNLARGWINHSLPNYGVILRAPESGGNDFAFIEIASRSWAGYEPYLQITYAGATALEQPMPAVEQPSTFACTVTETGISVCSEASSPAKEKH
jgi:hypothetical protein